jgi:hypothetical protein
MLDLMVAVALQAEIPDPNKPWEFACPSREFGKIVNPDYYSIGLIYYDYNKKPFVDPGIVPVLIDVKFYPKRKLTTYRFYFEGMSDRQLYYVLDSQRLVVEKFLNTPYTRCPTP